ncbi:hypothetical protein OG601_46965 [Streptomyces sp. NBC_01239]|uniref:DUF6197 family protein n=1 Tax=Streptomyces sp. NBC_01239 TaxID=2903792 RepID=UPI00225AD6B9|nr:hypothetical protein [Streptomyces sp. NBC_01239]MCX4809067.1 hypothetical protein [Streptomyces sp. NBC_01239]MCX4818116.1 hypothetical protein [Streptomyces sp. NBC_01239]
MSTVTDLKPADIADVLDLALAHLERVGHTKGYLYDEFEADKGRPITSCPVCLWGAIHYAVHGEPRPSSTGTPEQFALARAAGDAVKAHLGVQVLAEWNDAKGRQKRQVAKAFRDTAAGLRAGVSA